MIPLIGIGSSMLTVVGVAYGSKDYDKLKLAHSYSIKLGYIISITLATIMYFGSDYIGMLFTYSPQSAPLAPLISRVIRLLCFFLLAMPAGIMSSMTFQGVGKGLTSLALTLSGSLLFEIIFAYLFSTVLCFNILGVYGGLIIGCAVGSIISFVWCRRYINRLSKNNN